MGYVLVLAYLDSKIACNMTKNSCNSEKDVHTKIFLIKPNENIDSSMKIIIYSHVKNVSLIKAQFSFVLCTYLDLLSFLVQLITHSHKSLIKIPRNHFLSVSLDKKTQRPKYVHNTYFALQIDLTKYFSSESSRQRKREYKSVKKQTAFYSTFPHCGMDDLL